LQRFNGQPPFNQTQKRKVTDIAMEAGCALAPDGKRKPELGVPPRTYDSTALDIVKNKLRCDTPSLYTIRRRNFEDTTFTGGSANTRSISVGLRFFDFDNDGWPDILILYGTFIRSRATHDEALSTAQAAYRIRATDV